MQPNYYSKKIQATILNSIGANSFGQILGALYQVLSVPLYINAWNIPLYGQWLLLSTIPGYLAMCDIGLVSAAANEMTILVAKNRHQEALRVFQSIGAIIIFVSFLILLAVSALIFLMPSIFFDDRLIGTQDLSIIVICLSFYSILSLQEGLLNAGFRAGGLYTFSVWLGNIQRVLEVSCVLIALSLKASPAGISILMLLIKALSMLVYKISLSRKVSWLIFGFELIRWQEIRKVTQPALGFMAFPVANIIKNQGIITLIGAMLGVSEIVIFSSVRTICNTGLQLLKIVQHSFWPEVSVAFAKKNIQLIQKINVIICGLAFWLGFLMLIVITLFGNAILVNWTLGEIQVPVLFLLVMCLGNFASGIWSSGSTILMAINYHSRLAFYYLFSTAAILMIMLMLGSGAGLLEYAALSTSIELFLTFIVLRQTLPIVHQSFWAFAKDMMLFPVSIYQLTLNFKCTSRNTHK